MFIQKLQTGNNIKEVYYSVSVVIVMSHCIIIIIRVIQNGGKTCLMVASGSGHIDIVRVLLEANANPNITNKVKLHYSHCLTVFRDQYLDA